MMANRQYDDSYLDKRWFQKIREALLKLNIDIENTGDTSLEISQKLLESPLFRSFSCLETLVLPDNGDYE